MNNELTDSEVVWVKLDSLTLGLSPREGLLDPAHVTTLTELDGRWPPIVVSCHNGGVIDGHHRVAAARRIGHDKLRAVLFDDAAEDAFAEAVRRNVEHGLPLSIQERKSAARRLLGEHVDWSDRRIAEVCALSARTVARLRSTSEIQTNGDRYRVGKDGRTRAVHHEATRQRIAEAVRANPDASLRAIAEAIGTSPETVRRVRQRLDGGTGCETPPDSTSPTESADVVSLTRRDSSPVAQCAPATADQGLTSTANGERFATWFDRTEPGGEWQAHVAAIPLSRVYEIADEARRRANVWNQLAELVEQRARTRRAG